MQVQVKLIEKRKFNFVILGLLAITIAMWSLRMIQNGFTLPY
jgi:hypothetical protein